MILPMPLPLILPHHWVWGLMDDHSRRYQCALDRFVNERREWPPTEEDEVYILVPWVGSNVLEVGAGAGQVTKYLAEWGRWIVALEPSNLKYEHPRVTWFQTPWETWDGR